MQENQVRAEAYMKGEERNAEKRSRDVKERGQDRRPSTDDIQRNTSQKRGPPRGRNNITSLSPLNQKRETIVKEILHTRLIPKVAPV